LVPAHTVCRRTEMANCALLGCTGTAAAGLWNFWSTGFSGYRLASALDVVATGMANCHLQGLARLGRRFEWPFCPRVRHTRGGADRVDAIFAVFCNDDVDRQLELKDDGACGGYSVSLGWQLAPQKRTLAKMRASAGGSECGECVTVRCTTRSCGIAPVVAPGLIVFDVQGLP
jgi:hypothetical protein